VNPFFSIITPTLQRESLVRCCDSVTNQTGTDWQHIVVIDCDEMNEELIERIRHPQRRIFLIGASHDYGNTPRHIGWLHTNGVWLIHLDDDNYLADDKILVDLAKELIGVEEQWAIFPIMRHGSRFFYDPPGCCYVDTANMITRREIGRWPSRPEYTLDGIFCDELKAKYPYKAFPEFRPIVVMEASLEGK
jgi:glycosyltransferase involved in cell wall biosynthesis